MISNITSKNHVGYDPYSLKPKKICSKPKPYYQNQPENKIGEEKTRRQPAKIRSSGIKEQKIDPKTWAKNIQNPFELLVVWIDNPFFFL
jgi:hypothetical protein